MLATNLDLTKFVAATSGEKVISDNSRVRIKFTVRPTRQIIGDGMLFERGEHEAIISKKAYEALAAWHGDDARMMELAAEQLERKRKRFIEEYKGPEPERAFPGSIPAEYRLLTERDPSALESLELLEVLPPAVDEAEERQVEKIAKLMANMQAATLQPLIDALVAQRDGAGEHKRGK